MGYIVFVYTESETETWCIGVKHLKVFELKEDAIKFVQPFIQKHPIIAKQCNDKKFTAIKGTELDEPMIQWDDDYDFLDEKDLTAEESKNMTVKSNEIVKELKLNREYGMDQGNFRIAVSVVDFYNSVKKRQKC